ncbi:MAG: Smr/MutS family protein [Gemmobacter sp.]
MSRRRTLRPDEHDLWQEVARTARPLHPSRPASAHPRPDSPPPAKPKPAQTAPQTQTFRLGQNAPAPAHRTLPGPTETAPLRMDRKTFLAMARGRAEPEARIDLHGLTLATAQPRLTAFILSSHAAGRRLVLVITGKGRSVRDEGPIPVRQGPLRHEVPIWLARPPLSAVVLQVTQAHRRHGGDGAFYVYLKRAR